MIKTFRVGANKIGSVGQPETHIFFCLALGRFLAFEMKLKGSLVIERVLVKQNNDMFATIMWRKSNLSQPGLPAGPLAAFMWTARLAGIPAHTSEMSARQAGPALI